MSYEITKLCTGCTLCAKNCPVFAIEGALKTIHTINEKRCINCGVCGRICPVNAIKDENGNVCVKVPKTNWDKPTVNKDRCSACSLCVDICTLDCLAISNPKFSGDIEASAYLSEPSKCVACKMCEDICPLDAIKMQEVTI